MYKLLNRRKSKKICVKLVVNMAPVSYISDLIREYIETIFVLCKDKVKITRFNMQGLSQQPTGLGIEWMNEWKMFILLSNDTLMNENNRCFVMLCRVRGLNKQNHL